MNHQPPSCSGCPLYGVSKGFVLGCGDPTRAKYALIMEAPGREETQFELRGNKWGLDVQAELEVRRRDYPDMLDDHLRLGMPAIGQNGLALENWVWPKVGIMRSEVFIDNTIRCMAPKNKQGWHYPIGDTKRAAELHCRQYDRISQFRPDTVIFSLHPSSYLREITPLPLTIRDWEKVRDFGAQGRRVVMMLGSKASGAFMRYGANITRWRGHYAELASTWIDTYKAQFEYHRTARKAKPIVTRPSSPLPACKSSKRYKGKVVPKCGCVVCWDKYEVSHVDVAHSEVLNAIMRIGDQ